MQKVPVRRETGGAGERGLRTGFGIKLVMGMPLAQHQLSPFVAEPFRLSWDAAGSTAGQSGSRESDCEGLRHPICRVLEWQKRLDNEKSLTKVRLAEGEGFSKARIAQFFSLLKLAPEIQEHLKGLRSSREIQFFSVRRLMRLAKMKPEEQQKVFSEMQESL